MKVIDITNIKIEKPTKLSIQVSANFKTAIIDKAKSLNIGTSLYVRSILARELKS
jgi:hypothetical protein